MIAIEEINRGLITYTREANRSVAEESLEFEAKPEESDNQ